LSCFFTDDRYFANEEPLYQSIDDVVMVKKTEVATESDVATESEVVTEAEVATENFSEYDDVVSPIQTFPQQYEAPRTEIKDIYRVSDGMLPSRYKYELPRAQLKVYQ